VVLVANDTVFVGIQSFYGGATSLEFDWTPPAGLIVTKVTAFYSGYDAPPVVPANPANVSYRPSQGTLSTVAHGWSILRAAPPSSYGAVSDQGISSLNGDLVLFGGWWGDGTVRTVLHYAPTTDTWDTQGPTNDVRAPGGHAGRIQAAAGTTSVFDVHWDSIYLQNYTDVLILEERSSSGGFLRMAPPIVTDLTNVRGVVTLGGLVYVLGADISGAPRMIAIDPLSYTDTIPATWTRMDDLPSRVEQYAVVVANGRIYVLGGYDPNLGAYSDAVWEFDPAVGWNLLPLPMPGPRGLGGAALLGGKIYVAGGVDQNNTNASLGTVDVFTPPNYVEQLPGSWTTLAAPLPTPRQRVSVAAANGKLYVIGGEAYDDFVGRIVPFSSVEAYTP
jgi:hypothetical protein